MSMVTPQIHSDILTFKGSDEQLARHLANRLLAMPKREAIRLLNEQVEGHNAFTVALHAGLLQTAATIAAHGGEYPLMVADVPIAEFIQREFPAQADAFCDAMRRVETRRLIGER